MLMTIGWLLAAFLLTALLVRGAIDYAHRRGMLDLPGQRRSHQVPTPRGGGIGIVVAMLVCLPGVAWSVHAELSAPGLPGLSCVALLLVALAGWWDDHHPLPAWPRLAVQLIACALLCVGLRAWSPAWW